MGTIPRVPHLADESEPCYACNARWKPQRDGSIEMEHAATCSYILDSDPQTSYDWYERA